MAREVTVGAVQMAMSGEEASDIAKAVRLVEAAADRGAGVVLPPELFSGHYFCARHDESAFARARPADSHPAVQAMREVARRRAITIPASFFEADGPHFYNSLAVIGPGGEILGIYRKSHIPDGPGYMEKFYFRPGNTGFRVFPAGPARIGPAVCWDQWYPETARALVLEGAEILLFPTAIGSEPHDPALDTRRLWVRAMVGHAVSNVVPVVAANRVGTEAGQTFYGSSFICDERGDMLAEMDSVSEGVITARIDLDRAARHRAAFGFFRDRRPELYRRLAEDR